MRAVAWLRGGRSSGPFANNDSLYEEALIGDYYYQAFTAAAGGAGFRLLRSFPGDGFLSSRKSAILLTRGNSRMSARDVRIAEHWD
jgi:hypothetical protein